MALLPICVVMVVVQVVAVNRRPALKPRLQRGLVGSLGVGAMGFLIMAATELRWIEPKAMDDYALPMAIAALVWAFFWRIGHVADQGPKPQQPEPAAGQEEQ
jgi:hypothetical protein